MRKKYRMMMAVTVFLWLVLSGMEIYNVLQTYPLGGWRAPVQSLPFLNGVPFAITIWQYALLVYFIRLGWMILFIFLYTGIVKRCRSQEIGILLCGFTIIPSILYWMGMESVSFLAVTKLIHVSHFLRQGCIGVGKEAAAVVVILIVLITNRKMRTKGC